MRVMTLICSRRMSHHQHWHRERRRRRRLMLRHLHILARLRRANGIDVQAEQRRPVQSEMKTLTSGGHFVTEKARDFVSMPGFVMVFVHLTEAMIVWVANSSHDENTSTSYSWCLYSGADERSLHWSSLCRSSGIWDRKVVVLNFCQRIYDASVSAIEASVSAIEESAIDVSAIEASASLSAIETSAYVVVAAVATDRVGISDRR